MKYDDEHLLLYLIGKLDSDQQKCIQEEIARDIDLANEVSLMRAIKQGWQRDEKMPSAELGLARLKRDIAQTTPPSDSLSQRQPIKRFWKPLALAACLVVTLQTSVVIFQSTTNSQWSLLSGTPGATQSHLQIVPEPNITLVELEALLRPFGAEIIAGPGALGIYMLQLPQDSDIDSVKQQLSESDLIEEVNRP